MNDLIKNEAKSVRVYLTFFAQKILPILLFFGLYGLVGGTFGLFRMKK